jgi:hypothetical protein
MTEQNVMMSEEKKSGVSGKLASGMILITIGLGLLLFNAFEIAMYFPLVLGMVFITAGIATRSAGFLIPGGIVGGVGLGTLATINSWLYPTGSQESGGVFLLVFSLGWFSIALLSKLFTPETHNWALIPGGIMAAIGGLVLMGEQGTSILMVAGKFWPVILVVLGVKALFGWWKERE